MATQILLTKTSENLKKLFTLLKNEIEKRPYIKIIKEEQDLLAFYINTDIFVITAKRESNENHLYTHKRIKDKSDLNIPHKWIHEPKLDIRNYIDGNVQLFTKQSTINANSISRMYNFGKDYFDLLETLI